MKLFHVDEARQLVQRIDKCKGDVFLILDNGDRLNLKDRRDNGTNAVRELIEKKRISEMDLHFTCGADAVAITQCLF